MLTKPKIVMVAAMIISSSAAITSASPVAEDWVALGISDVSTGAKAFVDRNSTRYEREIMFVRIKTELKANYGPPNEQGWQLCTDTLVVCASAGTTISTFALHCKSRSYAEVAETSYGSHGDPRSATSLPRSQWEFKEAPARTLADYVLAFACREQAPKPPVREKSGARWQQL